MSIAVTVQEAQTKLHELINLVESGEEVFITKSPSIKFKLTLQNTRPKKRQFGQHLGKATMREDFDAPLSDDFWLGE